MDCRDRARAAFDLDAADAVEAVADHRVDLRPGVVPGQIEVDLRYLELLAQLDQVGALLERRLDRALDVDVGPRLRQLRRVGQVEIHRPEVRRLRVVDQRAELILGLVDLRGRDDGRFLVAGDFGFGADDVDRRHRADFDAGPVVAQRLPRDVERGLGDAQVVARADQRPVGEAHLRASSRRSAAAAGRR